MILKWSEVIRRMDNCDNIFLSVYGAKKLLKNLFTFGKKNQALNNTMFNNQKLYF